MKLKTNFIQAPDTFVRVSMIVTWLITAFTACAAIWMTVDGFHLRRAQPAIDARMAQLNQRMDSLSSHSARNEDDLRRIKEKVKIINQLGYGGKHTLEAILRKLEMITPDTVYLIRLEYGRHPNEANLVAESRDNEALTRLLAALEAERAFEQVLLTKQLRSTTQGETKSQFAIRVRVAG